MAISEQVDRCVFDKANSEYSGFYLDCSPRAWTRASTRSPTAPLTSSTFTFMGKPIRPSWAIDSIGGCRRCRIEA